MVQLSMQTPPGPLKSGETDDRMDMTCSVTLQKDLSSFALLSLLALFLGLWPLIRQN